MITNFINAIGIQNGGGLSYLYSLIYFLDKKNNLIILDNRSKKKLIHFNNASTIFLKRGPFRNLRIFFIRFNLYKNYFFKKDYDKYKMKEFYLNGVPPFIRYKFLNYGTYIFLQNRNLFDKSKKAQFILNFFFLKVYVYHLLNRILIDLFITKNDKLIVQTNSMRSLVEKKFKCNSVSLGANIWGKLKTSDLEVLKKRLPKPDKNFLKYIQNISSKNTIFFYPASPYYHKNHLNLIKAFNLFCTNSKKLSKLILTISEFEYAKFKLKNQNVICIGQISYQDILHLYKFVDYLIFPSISESYGMPLVESKINNIKIVASDLEYVKEVCNPYKVFDPFNYLDIYKTLLKL